MRQETYRSGLYITVGVPRALWRRVKYEAWRRETAAKNLLIEALEAALARWEAETDAKIQKRG